LKSLRILLDECIDRRLARHISHHFVQTVHQAGFAGLTNGKLLSEAQKDFDVFLTVDRNLTSQQNLEKFDIAIVVLKSPSNRVDDLQKLIPGLLVALPETQPHKIIEVGG